MGLSVLCMSITLDYIQLVPQSSVFRPLDSRLRTPRSLWSLRPYSPIGLIRLIGPIVLALLTDLRDLRVPTDLKAPTKKQKEK